ncbi:MBL fold metallo-hydrolase [Mycobacterium sp. pW049]|uniref:MBL fold metallo-hydrolase n=1 Tax=[Mycobacterium] bulgaricum TaxID=3238985 RepID=UPI00351AE169
MASPVWERVSAHVMRCRLAFCDVTVGVVHDDGVALIVDTGTTLSEAGAIADDVATLTGCRVGHVVLTHNHFDHVLGYSVFAGADTYCSPEVGRTMAERKLLLRADALNHGADPDEVAQALAVLDPPRASVAEATVTLGDVAVTISHPGRGHTDHDVIAVVQDGPETVVFCGDLVEESADPCIDEGSDLTAWPETLERVVTAGGEGVYVPGHGSLVDAAFVLRQAAWLASGRGH